LLQHTGVAVAAAEAYRPVATEQHCCCNTPPNTCQRGKGCWRRAHSCQPLQHAHVLPTTSANLQQHSCTMQRMLQYASGSLPTAVPLQRALLLLPAGLAAAEWLKASWCRRHTHRFVALRGCIAVTMLRLEVQGSNPAPCACWHGLVCVSGGERTQCTQGVCQHYRGPQIDTKTTHQHNTHLSFAKMLKAAAVLLPAHTLHAHHPRMPHAAKHSPPNKSNSKSPLPLCL
jgi:hypothetical protein